MQNRIKYVTHSGIDTIKWDACISGSVNRKIYAFSWYLDIVAPGWDALILDDYSAVMPLPQRSRFGIKYIYVPFLTQQLGVFYSVSQHDVNQFLDSIPHSFRMIHVKLNKENIPLDLPLTENSNYILSLAASYESIKKNYRRNCIRNLRKAVDSGLKFSFDITVDEFLSFFRKYLDEQMSQITANDFRLLKEILIETEKRKCGELACIRDKDGRLHAIGFFMIDTPSVVFTVCGSTPEGKEKQAMYLLVDSMIQKYAGKQMDFDFLGSNLKGVAYFNSGFGSAVEKYLSIKLNRLPGFLKLLKR